MSYLFVFWRVVLWYGVYHVTVFVSWSFGSFVHILSVFYCSRCNHITALLTSYRSEINQRRLKKSAARNAHDPQYHFFSFLVFISTFTVIFVFVNRVAKTNRVTNIICTHIYFGSHRLFFNKFSNFFNDKFMADTQIICTVQKDRTYSALIS